MREILFRGKSRESGEWLYGSLIKRNIGSFIVDENNKCSLRSCAEFDFSFDSKLVIPETVGQYTGLTDKNGKKIFEGDILRITERGCTVDGGIVVFENSYPGGWLIEDKTYSSKCSLAMRKDVEIIGNIHDNPELLEVDNG